MKQLFSSENQKLFISMFAVSLIALFAVALLSLAMVSSRNQVLNTAYAGIIGTTVQHDPASEAQLVAALRSPTDDAISLGMQILGKYGLNEPGTIDIAGATALQKRVLRIGLLFVGMVCAAFVLLFIWYQQAVSNQITELSNYLHRIDAGNYSLDVRDNGEGGFSLLKNDLYKVTVQLREQAELLQKDKAALSNLITDISHQIKTPLTSLGVLTDLLAEEPPETDRRLFVERQRVQLSRIQWLVDALLKLARLDAGTAAFKREVVNVSRLIERALEPLLIPLEIRRQQLVVHGETNVTFIGDLNWSAEALTNVIKNCIEHTPEDGKIEIHFSANALYTEIIVNDNGDGIARLDLPGIFNRFYRGENASENSLGIGLALAKAIFTTQEGDISVRSQPGLGTSFDIRIFRGVV